jgi:hypothetical protein
MRIVLGSFALALLCSDPHHRILIFWIHGGADPTVLVEWTGKD